MRTEWILWGRHPHHADGALIEIVGGDYREVSRLIPRYKAEGWLALRVKQQTTWKEG